MNRLDFIGRVAAGGAVLVGGIGLEGWIFDSEILTSLVPGWVSMKANTAVLLMGCGAALLLGGGEAGGPYSVAKRRLAFFLALLAVLVGGLTLAEYLLGSNIGLDQLLFNERAVAPFNSSPGRVVPVQNVADLLKSAKRSSVPAASRTAGAAVKKASVLVVEDSITARTLMVNILGSAGYGVTSAVDGVDGLVKFGEGEFDLVVTDIAMPNMNGFDLTARIRAGKKRPDLPVVIVTGLESPEDKRRGIDAGASAYIVKSSFDQSNLLGVIKRLL